MSIHLEKPADDEPRTLIDFGRILGRALLVTMVLGYSAGIIIAGVLHG